MKAPSYRRENQRWCDKPNTTFKVRGFGLCVCGVTILYGPSCPSGPNTAYIDRVYIERQDLLQGGPCSFLHGRERGGGGIVSEPSGTMALKCTLFENSIHSISDFHFMRLSYRIYEDQARPKPSW